MTKIIISNASGTSNIGDDAILQGMLSEIVKFVPLDNITIISRSPEKVNVDYKKLNIISSSGPVALFNIIKKIRTTDILIVGGGGILQDQTSVANLLYYLGQIFLAKIFRKRIFCYAVGVGPFRRKISYWLTIFFLKQTDFITVRDRKSEMILLQNNFHQNKLKLVADPAIKLDGIFPDELKGMFAQHFSGKENVFIGLNLRPWFFAEGKIFPVKNRIDKMKWLKKYQSVLDGVAGAIDLFIEKHGNYNIRVVFIPFVLNQDKILYEELLKKIKNKVNIIYLAKKYSPSQILGVVQKMDIMIGMRLHALIFSLSVNTPFVGIMYTNKAKEFTDQINQSKYCIDINKVSTHELYSLVQSVFQNKKEIKEVLAKEKISYMSNGANIDQFIL